MACYSHLWRQYQWPQALAVLIDGISGIDFPDLTGVAADAMNSATLQEEVVVECLCQAIVNS